MPLHRVRDFTFVELLGVRTIAVPFPVFAQTEATAKEAIDARARFARWGRAHLDPPPGPTARHPLVDPSQ